MHGHNKDSNVVLAEIGSEIEPQRNRIQLYLGRFNGSYYVGINDPGNNPKQT
jgi:hypothetical protein